MSINFTEVVVVVELFDDVGCVVFDEDAGRGDRWNHFGRVDAAFVQAMAIAIIQSHTLMLVNVRTSKSVDLLDSSGFKL